MNDADAITCSHLYHLQNHLCFMKLIKNDSRCNILLLKKKTKNNSTWEQRCCKSCTIWGEEFISCYQQQLGKVAAVDITQGFKLVWRKKPERCVNLGQKPLKWVENKQKCRNLDFMKAGIPVKAIKKTYIPD